MATRDRVLIAGGGVAALESAVALHRLAGDRVEVDIFSPREDFIYRPFAVAEPYGASREMRYRLGSLAERCGAGFHLGSIGSVDGDRQRARTHDGDEVSYDHLIVASGSRLLPGVPGAVTFWGVADDGAVRDVVGDLREGRARRVAYTMPGGNTWALPMYELALLAESELSNQGDHDAELVLVTPEDAPLHLFGRRASDRVAQLLAERDIEVIPATTPVRFEDGGLAVSPSDTVEADAVLSLPKLEGRRIGGVPHDAEGFVPVDDHGRVLDLSHAYAAGDVTNFPVKQGGIATQQADVIAESIAAELGCDVAAEPLDPVLRGVLWTGGKPLYLSGYLAGGHGETSVASEEPPWEGEANEKIVGRYLTPFLSEVAEAT
jgi:sulfide:quinone oxidoreductase